MQDIVFYVAAKETLGKVRDYSNMRSSDAPLLTLGVAVCLRMRVFDDVEVSTPYSIASFDGITDWQWCMDDDFNRSTARALVADTGGVSVHSVIDTVNGETMNFTEFVIQISNMNTEKLAAWVGSEGTKKGLTGELVGYDNVGHAVFVLQVEDFSVRNRVAGLGDPTVLDQEIVTRTQAELMVQTAVSTLDAAKQDKLGSGNAGTGISISSAGVISAGNVPQSAVTGLVSDLSNKQNRLSTGFWIAIDDDFIAVERFHPILGPYTSNTVTLDAGMAYRIYATNAAVTLDTVSIPNNSWGMEGHAEIFVANTGYIHTTSRVVLADALEPDAVNNCTVRFHDGYAIISVEDHIAGYIVVSATGTTAGTLPYALSSATQEYVAFDATLNGSTFDLSGAVTNREKHVVGNGYSETTLTGGVNCTSKTTFSNLSMNGVVNSGGTMTLGDVNIPNGGTLTMNGGTLKVEKVVGNGGVIDLGGTRIEVTSNSSAYASGCTITNGSNGTLSTLDAGEVVQLDNCLFSGNIGKMGTALNMYNAATAYVTGCTFSNNISEQHGEACIVGARYGGVVHLSSCTVSGNTMYNSIAVGVWHNNSWAEIKDCVIEGDVVLMNATSGKTSAVLAGSNTIDRIREGNNGTYCTVVISSGAVVNLTSSIAPGSGITFEPGGALVNAAKLDNMTVPRIDSSGIVNLGSSFVTVSSGGTAYASGCTFTSGYNSSGGAFYGYNDCLLQLANVTLTGNSAGNADAVYMRGTVELESCTVSGNLPTSKADIVLRGGSGHIKDCTIERIVLANLTIGSTLVAHLDIEGSNTIGYVASPDDGTVTISGGAVINLTSSIVPGGTIEVLTGGCTVNGNVIPAGTYTSIDSNGQPTE